MRTGLIAALLLGMSGGSTAQTQPLLQLQGQPYFSGTMTLHLKGTAGQPALLAYGLDPLTVPLQTGKGPWYVGGLINIVALGSVPMAGRIDLPFTMPPLMPAFAGLPIVMQGYVPLQLSNPAILRFDQPYFEAASAVVITSPQPQAGANFGDRFTTGDLDADGSVDLIVGAWFEDYLGIDASGRAYILWGPDFGAWTALNSPSPQNIAGFGASVNAADLNLDGIDDLIVGEIVTDPPTPPDTGSLYAYPGNGSFTSPSFALQSPGTGLGGAVFGRHAIVGDLNDDGWPDVVESSEYATVMGLSHAGRITVFWGPGFAASAQVISPTPGSGDFFGSDIAVGDVTGDGVDDLIAGSSREDVDSVPNVGKVHVFSGPDLQFLATIPSPFPTGGTGFGDFVLASDLNGDGTDEVMVSDQRDRVYVYSSSSFQLYQLIPKPPTTYVNPFGEKAFGFALDVADTNEDGDADLLICDPFEGGTGMLYISLGPHFSTFYRRSDKVVEAGLYATSVLAFDLDGDGDLELLVNHQVADDGGLENSGHVTIFGLGS